MASAAKPKQDGSSGRREVFDEFFNDYFKRRKQIFYLNFVRGIFFGLGSVLGGTIVLALLLWVLSFFQQIPFLTDIIQKIQHAIESGRN